MAAATRVTHRISLSSILTLCSILALASPTPVRRSRRLQADSVDSIRSELAASRQKAEELTNKADVQKEIRVLVGDLNSQLSAWKDSFQGRISGLVQQTQWLSNPVNSRGMGMEVTLVSQPMSLEFAQQEMKEVVEMAGGFVWQTRAQHVSFEGKESSLRSERGRVVYSMQEKLAEVAAAPVDGDVAALQKDVKMAKWLNLACANQWCNFRGTTWPEASSTIRLLQAKLDKLKSLLKQLADARVALTSAQANYASADAKCQTQDQAAEVAASNLRTTKERCAVPSRCNSNTLPIATTKSDQAQRSLLDCQKQAQLSACDAARAKAQAEVDRLQGKVDALTPADVAGPGTNPGDPSKELEKGSGMPGEDGV